MPLPTLADAKAYLRVEVDDENALIQRLLDRAQAAIERFLGYALTAAARTHVDYTERDNYGVQPRLTLPGPFKTTSPAPIVTDKDGSTVAATDYYLDDRGLQLLAKQGVTFPNRPYTIVATVGLSAHPDYTAILETVVSTAILDLVAHKYQNRNPGIASETDEGGNSVNMGGIGSQDPIPPPIVQDLLMLPGADRLVLR